MQLGIGSISDIWSVRGMLHTETVLSGKVKMFMGKSWTVGWEVEGIAMILGSRGS